MAKVRKSSRGPWGQWDWWLQNCHQGDCCCSCFHSHWHCLGLHHEGLHVGCFFPPLVICCSLPSASCIWLCHLAERKLRSWELKKMKRKGKGKRGFRLMQEPEYLKEMRSSYDLCCFSGDGRERRRLVKLLECSVIFPFHFTDMPCPFPLLWSEPVLCFYCVFSISWCILLVN